MLAGNIKGESKFVEAIIRYLSNRNLPKHTAELTYDHLKKDKPKFGKWQFNRVIKRLKDSERIRVVEREGKLFIELTKKGKLTSLLGKLDLYKYRKWDGKWRLMIWDIPESSNKQRDAIRRFVKRLGFYQLQKSVYITPYELPSDAVEYLMESGLWKFIRFLRVDRLDDDENLKKYFRPQK